MSVRALSVWAKPALAVTVSSGWSRRRIRKRRGAASGAPRSRVPSWPAAALTWR